MKYIHREPREINRRAGACGADGAPRFFTANLSHLCNTSISRMKRNCSEQDSQPVITCKINQTLAMLTWWFSVDYKGYQRINFFYSVTCSSRQEENRAGYVLLVLGVICLVRCESACVG